MIRCARFVFGSYVLDVRHRAIWKDGDRLRVPPRALLVLAFLLERAGCCVTATQILDELWPDQDVCEGNVTQYIAILRRALADDAREPVFISSEYGKGYRFIGSVADDARTGADVDPALFEAQFYLAGMRPHHLRLALIRFDEARERDGGPMPLLGLAETYATLASHMAADPGIAFERARWFASDAARLNPPAARLHAIWGHIALFCGHDPGRAADECNLALGLDPNDPLALRVMSRICMVQSRWSAARSYLHRELRMRPESVDAAVMLAVVEQYERRPAIAANLLKRICVMAPSYAPARYYLGTCLTEAGCAVDAVDTLSVLARAERPPHVVAALGRAHAAAGNPSAAKRLLDSLLRRRRSEYVSSYLLSGIYAALGRRRDACSSMAEAQKRHDPWAIFFPVEPRFDAIRR